MPSCCIIFTVPGDIVEEQAKMAMKVARIPTTAGYVELDSDGKKFKAREKASVKDGHIFGDLVLVDLNEKAMVRLDGYTIHGSVKWSNACNIQALSLERCTVYGKVDLRGAQINKLSLIGTEIKGSLHLGLNKKVPENSLPRRGEYGAINLNGCTCYGFANLGGIKAGSVSAVQSRFHDVLSFRIHDSGPSAGLHEGWHQSKDVHTEITGRLDMHGAKVGGNLTLRGATIGDAVILSNAEIGGSLCLRPWHRDEREDPQIEGIEAKPAVPSQADSYPLFPSTFGRIDAPRLVVKGLVDLSGATIKGLVNLQRATVGSLLGTPRKSPDDVPGNGGGTGEPWTKKINVSEMVWGYLNCTRPDSKKPWFPCAHSRDYSVYESFDRDTNIRAASNAINIKVSRAKDPLKRLSSDWCGLYGHVWLISRLSTYFEFVPAPTYCRFKFEGSAWFKFLQHGEEQLKISCIHRKETNSYGPAIGALVSSRFIEDLVSWDNDDVREICDEEVSSLIMRTSILGPLKIDGLKTDGYVNLEGAWIKGGITAGGAEIRASFRVGGYYCFIKEKAYSIPAIVGMGTPYRDSAVSGSDTTPQTEGASGKSTWNWNCSIHAEGIKVGGFVRLTGAILRSGVNMLAAEIKGSFFADSFQTTRTMIGESNGPDGRHYSVRLSDATIGAHISMMGCYLASGFSLENSRVGGDIFLRTDWVEAEDWDFKERRTYIGPGYFLGHERTSLLFNGLKLEGDLDMRGIFLDKGLLMSNARIRGSVFVGALNRPDDPYSNKAQNDEGHPSATPCVKTNEAYSVSYFGRAQDTLRAKFSIIAMETEIGGDFVLSGGIFECGVRLSNATVRGHLDFQAFKCSYGNHVARTSLGVGLGSTLDMSSSSASENPNTPQARSSLIGAGLDVKGSLYLQGAYMESGINLAEATIGGSLIAATYMDCRREGETNEILVCLGLGERIKSRFFLRLSRAKIGGQLDLTGILCVADSKLFENSFKETTFQIDLRNVKCGGRVSINDDKRRLSKPGGRNDARSADDNARANAKNTRYCIDVSGLSAFRLQIRRPFDDLAETTDYYFNMGSDHQDRFCLIVASWVGYLAGVLAGPTLAVVCIWLLFSTFSGWWLLSVVPVSAYVTCDWYQNKNRVKTSRYIRADGLICDDVEFKVTPPLPPRQTNHPIHPTEAHSDSERFSNLYWKLPLISQVRGATRLPVAASLSFTVWVCTVYTLWAALTVANSIMTVSTSAWIIVTILSVLILVGAPLFYWKGLAGRDVSQLSTCSSDDGSSSEHQEDDKSEYLSKTLAARHLRHWFLAKAEPTERSYALIEHQLRNKGNHLAADLVAEHWQRRQFRASGFSVGKFIHGLLHLSIGHGTRPGLMLCVYLLLFGLGVNIFTVAGANDTTMFDNAVKERRELRGLKASSSPRGADNNFFPFSWLGPKGIRIAQLEHRETSRKAAVEFGVTTTIVALSPIPAPNPATPSTESDIRWDSLSKIRWMDGKYHDLRFTNREAYVGLRLSTWLLVPFAAALIFRQIPRLQNRRAS